MLKINGRTGRDGTDGQLGGLGGQSPSQNKHSIYYIHICVYMYIYIYIYFFFFFLGAVYGGSLIALLLGFWGSWVGGLAPGTSFWVFFGLSEGCMIGCRGAPRAKYALHWLWFGHQRCGGEGCQRQPFFWWPLNSEQHKPSSLNNINPKPWTPNNTKP